MGKRKGVKTPRWTKDEVSRLKAIYETWERAAILKALPGRSWETILNKARAMGMTRHLLSVSLAHAGTRSQHPIYGELAKERIARRIRQEDLAKDLEIVPEYLSGMETGAVTPGRALLFRWADALGFILTLQRKTDALITAPGAKQLHEMIEWDASGKVAIFEGAMSKQLTMSEKRLLSILRPTVKSKRAIHAAFYSDEATDDPAEEKIIDVFICKLRAKMVGMGIEVATSWGEGYYLARCVITAERVQRVAKKAA